MKSQSFSVQAAAAVGVLRIDPSRVSEFMDLPDEVVGSNYKLVAEMLGHWIENNDHSKLKVAADAVAFYLFEKFEDEVLGTKLERGFHWVLESNDLESTKIIADTYTQVYRFYANDNPNLAQALRMLLDQAITIKSNAFKQNPDKGFEEQIKVLTDAKASIQ